MSTEIQYFQYKDDLDGFEEFIEYVTDYVTVHYYKIHEITDIYCLIEDLMESDGYIEIDHQYLQDKFHFNESKLATNCY